MNTNTTQVIATTVSAGVFAGFIGVAVTGNILAGVAIGVSYLTVAALIAMVASDYRTGPKPYFATPVVSGNFPRVSASIASRVPSVKDRMAA